MAFAKGHKPYPKGNKGMNKPLYSDDSKPDQAPDIILKDGTLAVGGQQVIYMDKPLSKDYAAELAFMEEEIVVTVNETTDENAENPITVGNNGVFKQFFRGVPTLTKRKFLDSLIVLSGRVTTPEIQVQGVRGQTERSFTIHQKSAHKYPFTVNEDKNQRGAEWVQRRLRDGV